MFEVGDFVKIKNSSIYGIVVDYINVFDICQETEKMFVVSINNSKEIKVFKQDSIQKVSIE